MIDVEDTIVAIASPTSPAVRGIVRLSGSDVAVILRRMGVSDKQLAIPAARRFAVEIETATPLGRVPADVMHWPTQRSYTGQPSAELHTFGSLPVLQALVDAAIAAGGRAARPGEFTMRAFLAGRLDLTQAEAVLGVIEAEHRGSLDHALRQLSGNLSKPLEHLRSEMLDLLADVEAGLDFVDEDIEFVSDQALIRRLSEIAGQLEATRQTMQTRSGGAAKARIALRGEPNAGKSRLVNALAGQDAAIVADVAGTTRDAVAVDVQFQGHAIELLDTAGIESASSEISQLSQQQTIRAAASADLCLWCVDGSRDDFDLARRTVQTLAAQNHTKGINLFVVTKMDRVHTAIELSGWTATSAETGLGIESLRQAMVQSIQSRVAEEVGSVVGTAARSRQSLSRASAAVEAAIQLTESEQGHEFVAAELRTAVTALGEVTGAVYTDDILDRVFGRFCIGK
jgi:tRNA modification GTPase